MPWVAGVLAAVCGSVFSNLGVNIQKYSFVKNAEKPKQQQKKYIKQPLWIIGLSLVVLGSLGDFGALALVAQSIVAPIGSVTLVTNVIFAHYWLKEKLGKKDLFGTALIVVGCVVSVAFGDHNDINWNLDQIRHFWGGGLFLAFFILSLLILLVLFVMVRKIEPMRKRLTEAIKKYEAALANNSSDDIEENEMTVNTFEEEYRRYERFHPFSLCALSGVFGGFSVLFGKMVAELIASSASDSNQFASVIPFTFIAGMLVNIFAQLHFLAMALNNFDALYCIPVFQCFFIATSTFGGACFFEEFSAFGVAQALFFPLGLMLTLTGVLILSTRQMAVKRSVIQRRKKTSEMEISMSKQSQIIASDEYEEEHQLNGGQDEFESGSDLDDDEEENEEEADGRVERRTNGVGYDVLPQDARSEVEMAEIRDVLASTKDEIHRTVASNAAASGESDANEAAQPLTKKEKKPRRRRRKKTVAAPGKSEAKSTARRVKIVDTRDPERVTDRDSEHYQPFQPRRSVASKDEEIVYESAVSLVSTEPTAYRETMTTFANSIIPGMKPINPVSVNQSSPALNANRSLFSSFAELQAANPNAVQTPQSPTARANLLVRAPSLRAATSINLATVASLELVAAANSQRSHKKQASISLTLEGGNRPTSGSIPAIPAGLNGSPFQTGTAPTTPKAASAATTAAASSTPPESAIPFSLPSPAAATVSSVTHPLSADAVQDAPPPQAPASSAANSSPAPAARALSASSSPARVSPPGFGTPLTLSSVRSRSDSVEMRVTEDKDENSREQFKRMTAIPHVMNGLVATFPLLGPLTYLAMNANQGINNDGNIFSQYMVEVKDEDALPPPVLPHTAAVSVEEKSRGRDGSDPGLPNSNTNPSAARSLLNSISNFFAPSARDNVLPATPATQELEMKEVTKILSDIKNEFEDQIDEQHHTQQTTAEKAEEKSGQRPDAIIDIHTTPTADNSFIEAYSPNHGTTSTDARFSETAQTDVPQHAHSPSHSNLHSSSGAAASDSTSPSLLALAALPQGIETAAISTANSDSASASALSSSSSLP